MTANRTTDPSLFRIRAAGLIAVAAGLANAVADYALRGGPRPVAGADLSLEIRPGLGSLLWTLFFATALRSVWNGRGSRS